MKTITTFDPCPSRDDAQPHIPAASHRGPGPNVCAFCLAPMDPVERLDDTERIPCEPTDLDTYKF